MDATLARALADERIDAVRHDCSARLRLAATLYRGRYADYGRAELSFLRWSVGRGVLHSAHGSPWWRGINDSLLRDKVEAAFLSNAGAGQHDLAAGTPTRFWLEFLRMPSPARWYRAHNASIAHAYLRLQDLAAAETPGERLMINVALMRVIYAHALVESPRLALGRFARLGPRIADPRGGAVGMFLDLRDVFPQRYPLDGVTPEALLCAEGALPRALDTLAIMPRLRQLYDFEARQLGIPQLRLLHSDGVPSYTGLVLAPHVRQGWERHAQRSRLVTFVARAAFAESR